MKREGAAVHEHGAASDLPVEPVRVLVTGAGTGPSNNLIRSLRASRRDLRIYGCYEDRFLLAKSPADRNFLVPEPSDERFVGAIRQVIESERIDLIIPKSDDETLAIARIRESLPCRVYLPSTQMIELCQDKYELTKHLDGKGILVPVTYPVESRADVAEIFAQLGHPPLVWCRTRKGAGSRAATMVKNAEQAWNWISYWIEMRGATIDEFTLSEFLPGRDFNVQGLWHEGRLVIIKMCERLSYLDGHNRPSGMSSTPGLAKTVRDDRTLDLCKDAVQAIDPAVSGIFSIDVKQDGEGRSRITEINAGRFAMITNIYDFTGEHNMAEAFVRLALGELLEIENCIDIAMDYYLIRDYDVQPDIVHIDKLALYDDLKTGQTVGA